MDELDDYRRLRPDTIELTDEVRERVLTEISHFAEPAKSPSSRPRVAAASLLVSAVALGAGFVVVNNIDSTEDPISPVAGSLLESTTPSTTQFREPLPRPYEFGSLPAGVTADPVSQEVIELGDDIERAALVQLLTGPEGAFARLTVVPGFRGEPPPFQDPVLGALTLSVSTPVGNGLLVQATEPGGTNILYIVTAPGDLLVLSSARLDTAGLEALSQELVHR